MDLHLKVVKIYVFQVDLGLNMGSLTIFSSPRQLHVLFELMHGLSQPDTVDTR